MKTADAEAPLFAEKDRIYRMFSEIAQSLRLAFFDPESIRTNESEAAGRDILQHVLDHTRQILKAEKCALFLADVPATSLILERVSGEVNVEKLKDIATYDLRRTGPGSGVTPWVYHRRKPFNARNFDELQFNSEGHWKGNWDSPMYGGSENARAKFQCVYMAPLMAGDQALGVIKYENRTSGAAGAYFDKKEERLIDMIAALVTNLVISQRIERNRYDRILPVISTALVSHFDKPSSYEPLLETCRGILSADIASLFLLDEQSNLMLESIVGVSQDKKDRLRGFGYEEYRKAKGLTPWILTKKTPFNVRSYPDLRGRSENHHLGKWDEVIYEGRPAELFKSLYSVPLVIGDEPIGVFKVENKNIPPYYFTESDERLFDLIGRLIAVGVRYAKTRVNEQYLLQMARNVELGYLAAGISHQFNTYLQRMLSGARLALDICEKQDVRQELIQIMSHIGQANKVINLFSSMRTASSGAADIRLDEVIESVLQLSGERFRDHLVDVSYHNFGVDTVHLNLGEVQSIVINLINNAFDAVTGTTERARTVEIVVRPDQDDRFVIEVSDSGLGIPPHLRNFVFAPYFTTKSEGMGIGLYLVLRLVNNMGGRIKLVSPNDHGGATFSVNLPRQTQEKE
jgi:signal transduction histidine kinase